jgi:serine protease AprX
MKKPEWSSINWGKGCSIVMLLFLVTILVPTISTSVPHNIHPLLLSMAEGNPNATISIIVQKTARNSSVEETAKQLGATISQDLWIINGFAAEIKASNVLQLAQVNGVRWISWDAPVQQTDCTDCTNNDSLANAYIKAINADKAWAKELQGKGIGVAVVDSGVNWQTDLYTPSGVNRVVANVAYNNGYNQTTFDAYGHGSHVAGVIGGNGRMSNGMYVGVAPQSNIINVKVSDDLNAGRTTDKNVVAGLQWILQNKTKYNIRVVNISINGSVDESYHTNPLDAAAEVLWFNGIVVVVSAGNKGSNKLYPPANDPFVITVGAVDDKGTAALSDDAMASFSAYGTTVDKFNKPDLVAPGKNIVSLMGNGTGMPVDHPANIVRVNGAAVYFRMSGTSTSAPIVAGAVALLLQDEPKLNPDQVKYRLKATANKSWSGYDANKAGAGYLDVMAAVKGTTTQTANTGLTASKLLWKGTIIPAWGSVDWGSVDWGSVDWGSVDWGSVDWGSVDWGSDYWGP